MGCGEELGGGGPEEGVCIAVAFTRCAVATGDELRAGTGECGDSLMELFAACRGEERLGGAFCERLRDLREEGLGLWSFEGEDEVGAGAELARACEDSCLPAPGLVAQPSFGERAGEKDDGVDAGHLEVDGFAYSLQRRA